MWGSMIDFQRIQEIAIRRSYAKVMTGFVSRYWVYPKLCEHVLSVEWVLYPITGRYLCSWLGYYYERRGDDLEVKPLGDRDERDMCALGESFRERL